MITKKECCKCDRILPVEAFGVDIQNPDGVRAVCKECHNRLRRERYKGKGHPPEDGKTTIKWG